MTRKKNKTLGIASGKTKDPEIIRELNDESVIEMLGGVPIYVHSNVQNAKIGLKTAERMIDTALKRSENAAKAELKSQLAYLGEKRREIKKQFGSEDNFKKIMQVLSSDNNKDVGSKIKNLLDLKTNATAFSKLQHA